MPAPTCPARQGGFREGMWPRATKEYLQMRSHARRMGQPFGVNTMDRRILLKSGLMAPSLFATSPEALAEPPELIRPHPRLLPECEAHDLLATLRYIEPLHLRRRQPTRT